MPGKEFAFFFANAGCCKKTMTPTTGLSSPHIQTVMAAYRHAGPVPQTEQWHVTLDDGDILSCAVSVAPNWQKSAKTVVLVHGLGGSEESKYMIRLTRHCYQRGCKVVRVNLRGCGPGKGLAKLPYNAGTSDDILRVLQELKCKESASPIVLMGFSLGGNIVLKLAGELGGRAKGYYEKCIAVSAPLDLAETVHLIEKKRHLIYHRYYLNKILLQAAPWVKQKVRSLYEFDNLVTAPLWGYRGADDYYRSCSSIGFLSKIEHETHILCAEDDPFVNLDRLYGMELSDKLHLYQTKHGGHMGFQGRTEMVFNGHWMDQWLLYQALNHTC